MEPTTIDVVARNDALRWWELIKAQSDAIPNGVNRFAGDIPALAPIPTDPDNSFLNMFSTAQERDAKPRQFTISPRAIASATGLHGILWLVARYLCDDPHDMSQRSAYDPDTSALTLQADGDKWTIRMGPYTLLLPDASAVTAAKDHRSRAQELAEE